TLQNPEVAGKFGEILMVRYNDVVDNGSTSGYEWSTDYWHTQTTPNPSAWTEPGTFVVHNAGQSWADPDCVDQCWATWDYYENTYCTTDKCRSMHEFERGWSHVSYWEGCSGSECQPGNCLNDCYLPYDLRGSVWPKDFYKYGPSGPTAWADSGGIWLRDEGATQNSYYYYGGPELTNEWLIWTGTIDYIISNFSAE
ncbi:MAG: hypothetical protein QGI45_09145, partial [Myxococcota bacterium]|nr:hypothetical protein [Myxococcota bacterium]